MNAQQLRTASMMWRAGDRGNVIAKAVGVKVSRLFEVASRYRHMFPKRLRAVGERAHFIAPPSLDGIANAIPADRMRWITEDGASVTLPRVSGIECPRTGAQT